MIINESGGADLWLSLAAPTTYADTRNAANGNVGTPPGFVGQDYLTDVEYWEIYRAALFFDTTALSGAPAAAQVTFMVDGKDITANEFDLVLVDGSVVATPPEAADYGDLRTADTTSFGTISSTALTTGQRASITLNAAGLAAINTGGVTKLALRSSLEIAATDPKRNGGDWYELVYFSASKLEIPSGRSHGYIIQ